MHTIRDYPKLFTLGLSIGAAYVLYQIGMFEWLDGRLHGYGYPAIFVAGLLFSFGFTTPFAIAAFVSMAYDVNPLLAAPLAGLGALASDFVIFEVLRLEGFGKEFERLSTTNLVTKLRRFFYHESIPERLQRYASWGLACFVIASPLPDELGVALISGTMRISERSFALLSVTMNTIGIYLVLIAARAASVV